MNRIFLFFFHAVLLGAGLAADAVTVSMADALAEPAMPRRKRFLIAAVFGVFQALMPLLGWLLVRTAVDIFPALERFLPWIALVLLCLIGANMLREGIGKKGEDAAEQKAPTLGAAALLLQGIATSIDALSVGFTLAEYGTLMAFVFAATVALVTFCLCLLGLRIGKRFGNRLAGGASVLGGVILIAIGLEIFLRGIL